VGGGEGRPVQAAGLYFCLICREFLNVARKILFLSFHAVILSFSLSLSVLSHTQSHIYYTLREETVELHSSESKTPNNQLSDNSE
jgi:hypothetical protein